MRNFMLFPLAALVALAPAAIAQSGSFIVSQHGQQVGTASFHLTPTPRGHDLTSVVRIAMKGLDYDLSATERLTPDYRMRQVQLSGSVNGSAVAVTALPGAAQIVLNTSANGHTTTTPLAAHPGAVFLADFDPGDLEALLRLAVVQNDRDLWAIIPKKAGSIVPIRLATYADQDGTLDGKPIVVHHLVTTISGAGTDLFSGPENQLLQAELPQVGFALIRKGFVLTPPSKAGAPPAAQPAAK